MRPYRISARAEADILSLTSYTLHNFGELALDRYLRLIEVALLKLCEDSLPAGAQEFENGIYKFHLSHCRADAATSSGQVKQPRHLIFFREDKDGTLEIIRVLHDCMDFGKHVDDE